MPLFNKMFELSQGKSISYNNKTIHRALSVNGPKKLKIEVKFIERNSIYRQGISFSMFTMKGKLYCNGETVSKGGFEFWEDSSPQKFTVDVEIDNGELSIFNISEYIDFRGIHSKTSLSKGMAFYYEEIGANKYRCYCNDWQPDDNFDDLVFDIEYIEN